MDAAMVLITVKLFNHAMNYKEPQIKINTKQITQHK